MKGLEMCESGRFYLSLQHISNPFTTHFSNMKKLHSIIIILIGMTAMPFRAMADEGTKRPIYFRPVTSQNDTRDYPRMPAYSPIYGELTGDILTIYSTLSGEAEVTVVAADGSTIVCKVADLSSGHSMAITADTPGITVFVKVSDRTYAALF